MRYKLSPLRYPGSKARVLSKIIPYIKEARKHCAEYREPFVGGGSVFINSGSWELKWANDIDPGIAALLRIIRDHPQDLIELVKRTKPTVHLWRKIRYSSPQTELERAFKVLFLNRTNYSGILKANPIGGLGQSSEYSIDCRWNTDALIKRITNMSASLKGAIITDKDFSYLVNKASGRKVFLFLDPPYYVKGNQLYEYGMSDSDHRRLRDLLSETEHLFLLTYDNCYQVWDLYGEVPGLYFFKDTWKYTTATVSSNRRKLGEELFISNFKVPQLPVKKFSEFRLENAYLEY